MNNTRTRKAFAHVQVFARTNRRSLVAVIPIVLIAAYSLQNMRRDAESKAARIAAIEGELRDKESVIQSMEAELAKQRETEHSRKARSDELIANSQVCHTHSSHSTDVAHRPLYVSQCTPIHT